MTNNTSQPLTDITSDADVEAVTAKVVLFIDVANAYEVDVKRVLERARQLGVLVRSQAYGDFRNPVLDEVALELYTLGVHLVHCPSWRNGSRKADGSAKRKQSDDRVLEAAVREHLLRHPEITCYVLLTADSDIIPTIHVLKEHHRDVLVIAPDRDGSLGHVLRMCDVAMEAAPLKPRDEMIADFDSEACLAIMDSFIQLEASSRYLTFSFAAENLESGSISVRQQLNRLIKDGVIERYEYIHPMSGQALPALRSKSTRLTGTAAPARFRSAIGLTPKPAVA